MKKQPSTTWLFLATQRKIGFEGRVPVLVLGHGQPKEYFSFFIAYDLTCTQGHNEGSVRIAVGATAKKSDFPTIWASRNEVRAGSQALQVYVELTQSFGLNR